MAAQTSKSNTTSGEYNLLAMRLKAEQTAWQQYLAQVHSWRTKEHQAKIDLNTTVYNLRVAAVDSHCAAAFAVLPCEAPQEAWRRVGYVGSDVPLCSHHPLCEPNFGCQVEANINEALTRMADDVTKPRDMLFKVLILNMTYLGPSHASCIHEAARILSDQLTSDPERRPPCPIERLHRHQTLQTPPT